VAQTDASNIMKATTIVDKSKDFAKKYILEKKLGKGKRFRFS
jgi:hypothetical protein